MTNGRLKMYYTTELDNGIKIIAEKMENIKSVSVGIWVKSGSRFENHNYHGLSHFAEHMLFKGTEHRSPRDIANEADDIAADLNAFTTREYTCLYLKVMDEYFERGLEIIVDVFLNSIFPEEEVEKERQVILEEIKMYNDTPEDIVHDLILEACYDGQPLSYNVLGDQESIKEIDRDILRDYYKEEFLSRETVIAVAGNIDPSKACSKIEEYFHKKGKTSTLEKTGKKTPEYRVNHKSFYKDIEQVHYCLSLPGLSYQDDRIYQLSLLNNILGGSMSSRLFQNIREINGLAYTVYSFPLAFHDCGVMIIYAGISKENLRQTGELIWENIEHLKGEDESFKITAKELERAKAQVKGSIIFGLESTNSRMIRLGHSMLLKGKVLTPEEVIDKIDNIKLNDLEMVANELFLPEKLSSSMVGPA